MSERQFLRLFIFIAQTTTMFLLLTTFTLAAYLVIDWLR